MENNVITKFKTVVPSSKIELQMLAVDIVKQLQDGEISGMELLKNFKMIEKLQEMIKDQMIKAALLEIDRHGDRQAKEGVDQFGVTFKKTEVGTKYDYSECGDQMYKNILRTQEELANEKTARESFLKAIKGSISMEAVDEDSGEIKNVTVYPPLKTSTTTLQVTIK